jgi:hypothetical protein
LLTRKEESASSELITRQAIERSRQRGVDLGLNDEEIAFYDALAQNNSATKSQK